MGEFRRTDPRKDIVERISETMEVVGLSIFVTTLTTMVAFGLGSMSAVPAIRWLCFYALPTIFIDFIYQITFFIALLVLDERRLQDKRRDCLFCLTMVKNTEHKGTGLTEQEQDELAHDNHQDREDQATGVVPADNASQFSYESETNAEPKNYAERFMAWYADQLMKTHIKVIVIVCFIGFLGLAMHRATLLEQEFRAEEIVPKDSYVKGFLSGVNQYSVQTIMLGAYFRHVDQANDTVQEQMLDFITELSEIAAIDEAPPFCWFRDFQKFEVEYADTIASVGDLSFSQKLDFALSDPTMKEVYGNDIVRDEHGNITASRCWLFMKHLDMQDVQAQTDMLLDQRDITMNYPVNVGRQEPAFFSFDIWYIIWVSSSVTNKRFRSQLFDRFRLNRKLPALHLNFFMQEFYTVAINELILTTIAGIVAVSIVGFIFIPHWTAVLFVSPLITTLYIDLLGKSCPMERRCSDTDVALCHHPFLYTSSPLIATSFFSRCAAIRWCQC